MNTEELKIIMDALVQLGEAGKDGFIWWLILNYGLYYVTVIFVMVVAVIAIRMVISKLASLTHGNQLGMELSQILKMNSNSWSNEYCRASMKAEIINRVRELLAQQK